MIRQVGTLLLFVINQTTTLHCLGLLLLFLLPGVDPFWWSVIGFRAGARKCLEPIHSIPTNFVNRSWSWHVRVGAQTSWRRNSSLRLKRSATGSSRLNWIMVNEMIVIRCVPPDSRQQNSRCCHRQSVEDRGGTVGVFTEDGTWEGDESNNHQ